MGHRKRAVKANERNCCAFAAEDWSDGRQSQIGRKQEMDGAEREEKSIMNLYINGS